MKRDSYHFLTWTRSEENLGNESQRFSICFSKVFMDSSFLLRSFLLLRMILFINMIVMSCCEQFSLIKFSHYTMITSFIFNHFKYSYQVEILNSTLRVDTSRWLRYTNTPDVEHPPVSSLSVGCCCQRLFLFVVARNNPFKCVFHKIDYVPLKCCVMIMINSYDERVLRVNKLNK